MLVNLPADPPPITIPPPPAVRWAGYGVLAQAIGVVVLSVVTLVSGLSAGPEGDSPVGRTLAQTGYYIVIALLMAAAASGILRGRRWGRTPCLVLEVVLVFIGVWLIAPSGQYLWGPVVVLSALVIGGLLLSPPANAWISRFPLPFGSPPPPAGPIR